MNHSYTHRHRGKSGQALAIVLPIVLILVIVGLIVVNNGNRSAAIQRKTSAGGEIRQKQEGIADMALKLVGEGILANLQANGNGGSVNLNTIATTIQANLQQQLEEANVGSVTAVNGNVVNPTLSTCTVTLAPATGLNGTSSGTMDLNAALALPYSSLTWPNIRWGFKAPGAAFIGKKWDFILTMTYQQTDNTSTQTTTGTSGQPNPLLPAKSVAYLITIYEIPAQTAVSGDNIAVGQEQSGSSNNQVVSGTVVGNQVLIDGTARISNNVAAVDTLTWNAGAQIGGHTLTTPRANMSNYNYLETLQQQNLVTSNHEVSVLSEVGKVMVYPLGNRAPRAAQANVPTYYLSPNTTASDGTAPIGNDFYSAYTYPYFATQVRIQCRNAAIITTPAADATATVVVKTYRTNTLTNRITQVGTETFTLDAATGTGSSWMKLINSPSSGKAMLAIDPNAAQADALIVAVGGAKTFYADVTDATGSRTNWGTGFYNGSSLTVASLSLVSPNTVYLNSDLNTGNVPLSIIAPHVAYSLGTGTPSSLSYRGQRGTVTEGSTTRIAVTNLENGTGGSLPLAAKSVTLNDVPGLTPSSLPPIVPLTWVITAQETVPGG